MPLLFKVSKNINKQNIKINIEDNNDFAKTISGLKGLRRLERESNVTNRL